MDFPDAIDIKTLRVLRSKAADREDVFICECCEVSFEVDYITMTLDDYFICFDCLAQILI